MRKYILSLFLVLFALAVSASQTEYNVADFGAKGDGVTLVHKAINEAIEACAAKGGGRVVVPAGTYLCGSIRLKSNVELHLQEGATILAAPESMKVYDEPEPFEGTAYQDGGHTYFHNSLIWADGQKNISITGRGTIDGKGLTKKDTEKSGILQSGSIGTGDKAIAFKCCRNILIRDITIYRGGHFGIILTGCELGTVDNVTIDTNRDGFDIDCCKYLTISNCKINTPRDDALVLKSSYALKKPVLTEHITINNCIITGYKLGTLLDGTYQPEPVKWVCGRFKLGTESNGGYKNITLSNCTFMYSSGLAFEEVDQGIMENITVSNITMNHVHHYPIYITTGRRNRGPKERTTVSTGRDIMISNLIANDVDSLAGIIVTGMPEHPLKNIYLSNIRIQYRGGGTADLAKRQYREQGTNYPEPRFAKATPAYGLYARHVDGLFVNDVTLTTIKPDYRPAVMLDDVKNEKITNLKADTAAKVEKLDRGLVIAKGKADGHYFASWRLLDTDPQNVSFTLLRDGKPYKTNITGATSLEVEGEPASRWQIVADGNYKSQTSNLKSQSVLPWSKPYLKLKLTPPPSTVIDGETINYTPNDCSVGDVDGDGQYELFIKWASNDKDNSQRGKTGNVYISCYKLDMGNPQNNPKCLWTINLGKNIRAGAHYIQFMVADFDGDGRAEMMCKTAPGSKDGKGRYVNLAATDKEILNADNTKDYRNDFGSIQGGQEYLTVFDGQDGHAINTVFYEPNRDMGIGGEADGSFNWNPSAKDNAHADNGSYGNRGNRFLACVAYLNGMDKNPCAIFTRGYYSYAFAWAVSFDGKAIHTEWLNESLSGKEYSVTDANGKKTTYAAAPPTSGGGSGTLYANGNHNLAVADVDGDGRDEMIWGAAALDDDGKVLYATGFGHGDAVHLADFNPSRPGYEVFDVHENKGKYCWDVHDACTGEILLKGGPKGVDNGRGLAAQLIEDSAACFWSAFAPEIRNAATGEVLSNTRASMNFRIYWDGDFQDELLDGVNIQKWTPEGVHTLGIFGVVKNTNNSNAKKVRYRFQRPTVSFNGYGSPASNNWTKNDPCLQCDLFGDWREEVICRDVADPSILYIYMSQIPTTHRMPSLMQDHLYRMGIAWQNVGYNQPPYKGKIELIQKQ